HTRNYGELEEILYPFTKKYSKGARVNGLKFPSAGRKARLSERALALALPKPGFLGFRRAILRQLGRRLYLAGVALADRLILRRGLRRTGAVADGALAVDHHRVLRGIAAEQFLRGLLHAEALERRAQRAAHLRFVPEEKAALL